MSKKGIVNNKIKIDVNTQGKKKTVVKINSNP